MPHIVIDYSANLDARVDIQSLCVVLRDATVATGVAPLAGIRVRALSQTFELLDGHSMLQNTSRETSMRVERNGD